MMKLSLAIGILLACALSVPAAPLVKSNDTLAICGDSITAQHVYSAFIEDYLLMCAPPVEKLQVVQFGWGGERAPGFLSRMQNDVTPFKPTIATTCYGMNDGSYTAFTPAIGDTYRKAQTAIVEQFKKDGVTRIVIGSPKGVDSFAFKKPETPSEVYNQNLGQLAEIDKDIAQKEGVVYADVYGAFMDAMSKAKAAKGPDYLVGGNDGVHPGANGSLIMAYAFLKALGYDGDISTITVDLDAKKAAATKGTKVDSFADGVVHLTSTRYPFCFSGGVNDKPQQSTASIIAFVPFNQDLNRYTLVVKGVKTKAKVTWGATTHEYTGEELAKGVNLMDQFIDNPFSGQFWKVHDAVDQQENLEQILSQNYMHNLPRYEATFPDAHEAIEQWATSGESLRAALMKGAEARIVPIQHTITIVQE